MRQRRGGAAGALWEDTRCFASPEQLLQRAAPNAIFVGVPPVAHGSGSAPLEAQLLDAGASCFVEKPVSLAPSTDVSAYARQVEAKTRESGLVTSVGYMFRYAQVFQRVREEIEATPTGRVLAFLGRYNCAYAAIDHPFWWDERASGGPIVEQATHFVDLSRFLAGEADLDTLTGVCIPADDPSGAGELCDIPSVVDESGIPRQHRLPRVTSATWRTQTGGVATLTHGLLLRGEDYHAELEVWGDGLRIGVEAPYSDCPRLRIRRGKSDEDEVVDFPGDDPYYTEASVFLNACLTGDVSGVRSSFQDAAHTHALSMKIREATKAASGL